MEKEGVISTVIVALVLASIVFLIIKKMVKNKKEGKSSCGCNCENCNKKCGRI